MIVAATPKADQSAGMFAPACGDLFAGAGGWSCGAEAAFCAAGDRALSKRDQVKLIGNSVCPAVAEAIVRENVVKQGVLDA